MFRVRLSGLALGLTVLVSCADLPPIEGGQCGNGVVDPGEQCDTFATAGEGTACGEPDDGELACHYTCKEDAPCPAGWGCGPDDRCRFASGFVSETTSFPSGFSEVMIGDADGDGAADIVGRLAGGNAVQAWYGDDSGSFGSRFHVNVGFGQAGASFGDLDDDGLVDVVVPLDEGVFVMLGKPDRTLAPVAYSSFELPTALPPVTAGGTPVPIDDLYTFTVGFKDLYSAPGLMFELGAPVNQIAFCFLNGCEDFSIASFQLLGDKRIVDLAGRMPRANVDVFGRPEEEFAIGFVGDSTVRIYTALPLDADGDGFFEAIPELRATISLPQPLVLPDALFVDLADGPRGYDPTAMHFGDVDGDGRLDFIAAVAGGDLGMQVAVARGNGDGTFQAAAVDARFAQLSQPDPDACELGVLSVGSRIPWPLAVADLDPSALDHRADYVTEAGIFMARGFDKLCPALIGYAGWTESAIGDFNHDGNLDVAAVGGDVTTGQRLRNVDFRTGDGTGHFNRVLRDTTHFATKLRAGDFDGDFVTDLALVELDWKDDATIDSESLTVFFGTAFGVPSAALSMGRLSYIDLLEPGYNPINALTFDVTGDLMAQSNSEKDGSGINSIAVMVGTPERRMLSPFALEGGDGPDDTYQIASVHVGDFALGEGAEPYDDLIAVTNRVRSDTSVDAGPSVWLIQGKARAEYRVSDARILTSDCPDPSAFAYGCALFTSGDLDGDGMAELIAVDNALCRGDSTGGAKLLVGRIGEQTITCTSQTLAAELPAPGMIRLVDLDGDARPEVLLASSSFGDDGGGGLPSTGGSVAILWNEGGTPAGAAPSYVPLTDLGLVLGGTAANLDADPERELVLLLERGIHVAQIDVTTRQISTPVLLYEMQFPFGQIVAGDVTGDELEDLVFSDVSQTRVFVSIAGGEEEVQREGP
jgi:hypothetical protein